MFRCALIPLACAWVGLPAALSSETNSIWSMLPPISTEHDYVGSKACVECHQNEHASWHRTFHRTMTQPALLENLRTDFSETTIDSGGLRYRIFRQGDEAWAEMPDPDLMMLAIQGGRDIPLDRIPRVQRRVVLATGSHHYHTFWVGSPRFTNLLQTLPLVYLIEDQRWVPREAAFMRGPRDTQRFITQWNHHCIRCHSTGGIPGLNEQTGMLETRVAEYGISCEACHGPARQHVEFRRAEAEQLLAPFARDPIINPEKLTPQRSAQVCGQCHGVYVKTEEFGYRYAREGPLYHPGDDLHKTRYYIEFPSRDSPPAKQDDLRNNPDFFRERWWDDGTILAGGREYTALSASGCYKSGQMSCLSCHSMHRSDPVDQLKRFQTDNHQCIQCHKEAKYTTEITRHTFHSAQSTGSNCLNCHMPHTTYALLKGIRGHQINSPSLENHLKSGAPNACNLCHMDKTLAWTQERLHDWYGQAKGTLDSQEEEVAAGPLWLLQGHAAQRIIAAWHAGWAPAQMTSGTEWIAPFLAQLLNDDYGVIRHVAGKSLRSLPGMEGLEYDFLGQPRARAQIGLNVRGEWAAQTRTNPSPYLLLDANGNLLTNRLAELLSTRDQRPVSIKE